MYKTKYDAFVGGYVSVTNEADADIAKVLQDTKKGVTLVTIQRNTPTFRA